MHILIIHFYFTAHYPGELHAVARKKPNFLYLVVVMMVLGGVARVIARAQFEHVCECRNQEEQQLQKQFLGCTDAEQEWYYEEKFDLYDLNQKQQQQEYRKYLVGYFFFCKKRKYSISDLNHRLSLIGL